MDKLIEHYGGFTALREFKLCENKQFVIFMPYENVHHVLHYHAVITDLFCRIQPPTLTPGDNGRSTVRFIINRIRTVGNSNTVQVLEQPPLGTGDLTAMTQHVRDIIVGAGEAVVDWNSIDINGNTNQVGRISVA